MRLMMRATLLLATAGMALAACSGGGGGGGATPLVTKFSDITGPTVFSARSASARVTNLGAVQGTGVDAPGASSATVTYDPAANGYRIQVNQTTSGGLVTFDRTFNNSHLAAVSNGVATYIDGGNSLIVPVPAQLGLDYTTFGLWVSAGTNEMGAVSGGFVTASMPTIGTANYNGVMAGYGVESGGVYALAAEMRMSANFGTQSVSGTFENGQRLNTATNTTSPFPNMAFGGTITPASSGFAGTITAPNANFAGGDITGNFYGPGANEVSGVWRLNGTTAAHGYMGGFVAKQ